MSRVWLGLAIAGSLVVGGGLALATTPRPVRSLIPDMTALNTWHASVLGALVVNREIGGGASADL